MKQIALGQSGLQVSEVCLGAMNMGTLVDEKTSFALLDAFTDAGGTFVDTSNNYAHWLGTGDESETLLGRWFEKSGKRQQVVLATKVGFDRHGQGQGLRRRQIEHWCEESLRKLKTDVIDLYYAHVDDMNTPVEEYMEAFNALIQKGKVRAIGASNFYTWRLEEARNVCEKAGLLPFSAVQQQFSYLFARGGIELPYPFNENAGIEKLRYLARYDLPLVAYSCMARGGYNDPSRMPERYLTGQRLETLQVMAAEKNVTPGALVIAWMRHSHLFADRPRVIPLFSSSKLDHLMENLGACEIPLSAEEAEKLNEA